MSTYVQLKGNLSLGPEDQETPDVTDYSRYISSLSVMRERTSITVPPNLETARESEVAGPMKETVGMQFHSGVAAASLGAELWDAMDTDSSILYFEGTLEPGAVSADNPKFSGYISVLTLETGADVGTLRQQSQTYPVYVGDVQHTSGPVFVSGVTKATS